jgi:hypothetical protein
MTSRSLAALTIAILATTAVPASALDLGLVTDIGSVVSVETNDLSLELDTPLTVDGSADVDAGNDIRVANAGVSTFANGSAGVEVETDLDETLDTDDDRLDGLLRLIRSSNWSSGSLAGLTDFDANAFDIDAWLESDGSVELEQVLEANAGEIADLQAALEANAAFNAWLETEGTDISAVIALGQTADGEIAIFTY